MAMTPTVPSFQPAPPAADPHVPAADRRGSIYPALTSLLCAAIEGLIREHEKEAV